MRSKSSEQGPSNRMRVSDPAISHRELPLPLDREPNLTEQFRMLQQLRSLVDQPQRPAAEPVGGLDPALLEAARRMFPDQAQLLEQLGKQLTPEDLRRLSENWAGQGLPGQDLDLEPGPPGSEPRLDPAMIERLRKANPELGRLLDDPQIRNRAEDMLREYSKTRRLPAERGSGGLPMLPPNNPPSTSNGGPRGQPGSVPPGQAEPDSPTQRSASPSSSAESRGNASRPGSDPPSQSQKPAPGVRSQTTRSRSTGDDTTIDPADIPNPFAEPMLEDASSPDRTDAARPPSNSSGASSGSNSNDTLNRDVGRNRSSRADAPGSQMQLAQEMLRELLPDRAGELMQEKRQPAGDSTGAPRASVDPASTPTPGQSARVPESAPSRNLPAASSSRNAASGEPRFEPSAGPPDSKLSTGSGGLSNPGDATAPPTPSMKAILDQANADPTSLPPLTVPHSSLEYFKDWLAERNVKKLERSDLFDKLKGAIPDKVREDLRDRGLDETLSKIVDRARDGLGDADQDKSPASIFGSESSTRSKSIQERMNQLADKAASSAQDSAAGSAPTKPGSSDTAAQSDSKSAKDKQSTTEAINDFFKKLTSASEEQADVPAADNAGQPATGFSLGSFLPAAAVGLLGLIAWWLLRGGSPAKKTTAEWSSLAEFQIVSREDVIRVFHLLARQKGGVEDWWTHRRLVQVWAGQQPSASESIEALARLYEIARYQPAAAALSDTELHDARAAMEHLRGC